jgi:peptide-methionine (S)-S-oxide reductase
MRRIAIYFLLSLSILIAPSVYADKAILAGGCFWCMEKDFESLEGVNDVISGFTGGSAVNPTYRGDHAGHYEAVEITYDPEIVSYQKILDHFWVNIDPFDAEGQFCDKGTSYLSAIFVSNQQERSIAEYSKQRVIEQFPEKNVVTPVLEASTFYPIRGDESYHQDFYKKSPIRYKTYRWSCGRDKRLREIWGTQATH